MTKQKRPSGTKAAAASFAAAVDEARVYIRKARELLRAAGLTTLTDEERIHSNGRMRADEPAAMLAICNAMDAAPASFAALAPHDGGIDDELVETEPTRRAIARWETIAPLAAELADLARDVGDDALAAAGSAKSVTVPAYAILRANAAIDPKLRKAGGEALDFYGSFGLRRAKENRRAANKAKKQAKASLRHNSGAN